MKPTTCRVCGCTDALPCPGGCSWTEPDLCSRCARPIVELLQSDNPNEVGAGLQRCFPAANSLLVRSDKHTGQVTVNVCGLDGPRVFAMLLVVAQHFGAQLGLQLQWIETAKRSASPIIMPNPKAGPFR